MTNDNIIVSVLLVTFLVYVAIVWTVLARRRRRRLHAEREARRRHEAGDAWDRLSKSAAGAP